MQRVGGWCEPICDEKDELTSELVWVKIVTYAVFRVKESSWTAVVVNLGGTAGVCIIISSLILLRDEIFCFYTAEDIHQY